MYEKKKRKKKRNDSTFTDQLLYRDANELKFDSKFKGKKKKGQI